MRRVTKLLCGVVCLGVAAAAFLAGNSRAQASPWLASTVLQETAKSVAVADIDLTNAVVVVRPGTLPKSESKAAVVLVEEIQKRSGLAWPVTTEWPASGTVIALTQEPTPGIGAEGYHLYVQNEPERTVVWVAGVDARGVLYGVGKLLRTANWAAGSVTVPSGLNLASSPAYPLRGHQLGYRATNNSCDAWTPAQYEQYIRELVIFGANAIENTPDDTYSPHMIESSLQMAHDLSAICDDYGIEYWMWTPASVDLGNASQRNALLAVHQQYYENCPRIDGIFVPGGDPGSNPPELVLPFLADLHNLLVAAHPNAGVWVSNQGFETAKNDYLFNYLQTNHPTWLAGLVYGPWTWMSLETMRSRTPDEYPIRSYPDITHNVRCQYIVPDWDPALAHTHNREASNPRPVAEAIIHNRYAPYTNGFIAYSDGTHDDVNKNVWSMKGWDPSLDINEIVTDYTRFFFGPSVSAAAASGIFGLEGNWTGPLSTNAGVDTAFDAWRQLESAHPELASNWRWQFCLLRAYYDKYIKERLANETALEAQANTALANAPSTGATAAMSTAESVLAQATSSPVRADLKIRISELCAALFGSIGYQCSVNAPYYASGLERSCVLDLVDWPVNNRLWLQQEFSLIRGYSTEAQKLAALKALLNWENPGPGGFYDDLGNAQKQPHVVVQLPWSDDPGAVNSTQVEFAWHSGNTTNLRSGAGRLSWQDQAQTLYGQPLQMHYTDLAPDASYTVRVTYLGRFNPISPFSADGIPLGTLSPTYTQPYQMSFAIPRAATTDGVLDLRWDLISGRGCQVAEVWLTTPDTDSDGLPDYWETRYGLDPSAPGGTGDPDSDGLTNAQEFVLQTNPVNADTDGDTCGDGFEVARGMNPKSPDTDADSFGDCVELKLGTNPVTAASQPQLLIGTNQFNVSSVLRVANGGTRFDRRTGRTTVAVTVTNPSNTALPILTPVSAFVKNPGPAGVSLAVYNGMTLTGWPYVNVSGAVLNDGKLAPGEKISFELVFNNPGNKRLTFEVGVAGGVTRIAL